MSKNGLFIALGTTANLSFSPAPAGAASTIVASAARITRFMAFLLCSAADDWRQSEDGPGAKLIDQHGDDDDYADEDLLPIGVGADQHKAVADHLDECGADDSTRRAAGAAGEISAADHRGSDHPQLVPCREIGGSSAQPACNQHAAESGGKAAQYIDRNDDARNAHTGQGRRLRIAANGIEMPAPNEMAQ